jgi:hypothetical protein
LLKFVNGPIYQTANWLISKDLSLMAAGVYLNDTSLYNQGYRHVIGQINQITPSGDIPELTRDFVHSQYVLIGLAQCAEIAYQQGDKGLFTASNSRIKVGAESYVLSVLGVKNPAYYSSSVWARKSAPYEILLNRYTAIGDDVPNVRYYVISQNRPEDGSEDHFVGWLSATHAIVAEAGESPVNNDILEVPGNLAFKKTGLASTEPQPENPANAALDNNLATRWSASGFPQWLEVDLGSVQTVGRTEVISYADRIYKYIVEAKKGETDDYHLVVDRSTNTEPGKVDAPLADDFPQVQARYLRLTVTGAVEYTGPWASITEFRVFAGSMAPLSSAIEVDWLIYPNPVSDTIFLKEMNGVTSIQVFDVSGAFVRKFEVANMINVSDLKSGVYILNIQASGSKYQMKFVKL